jgi:hypothetical protein
MTKVGELILKNRKQSIRIAILLAVVGSVFILGGIYKLVF